MPFFATNKRSKVLGIQTYAKAMRLPPEIAKHELDYLTYRDWYMNQVARQAQFEEEITQANKAGDKKRVAELGMKLRSLQDSLQGNKQRVQMAGERSYAECYLHLSHLMLSQEARIAIQDAVEAFLGRPMHELVNNK